MAQTSLCTSLYLSVPLCPSFSLSVTLGAPFPSFGFFSQCTICDIDGDAHVLFHFFPASCLMSGCPDICKGIGWIASLGRFRITLGFLWD